MRTISLLFVFLIAIQGVSASHNTFDPFVKLNDIDWFDREIYQGAVPSQRCIDLEEFYAYTDSDRYDSFDREDIKKYADRLSAADYELLANEKRGDNIDLRDLADIDDFYCSTRTEFDQFADQDRYDRFQRDDYFKNYGYDDEEQFLRINRHSPYETRYTQDNPYVRVDNFGGIASSIRPPELLPYRAQRQTRYSIPNPYRALEEILSNY